MKPLYSHNLLVVCHQRLHPATLQFTELHLISCWTVDAACFNWQSTCCDCSGMAGMQAGETPAEAAVRNVKREAGLSLEPKRFKFLCVTSFLWEQRREEPAGL